jgi:predicted NBD/HSP70 family sugar kinase
MKLAVDIGGSKTLLAVFDDTGHLVTQHKFPTPKQYEDFLAELATNINQVKRSGFSQSVVAVPGRLNRASGTVMACGNLPWKNEPIRADLSRIIGCAVVIENDANLAALHEAHNVKSEFKKVLYITISTGIGAGVIINGIIDPALADAEVGKMLLIEDGTLQAWETFASGKAVKEHFHTLVSDIPHDSPLWQEIAENLSVGIFNCCAIIQPDIVVLGGGAGTHYPMFKKQLATELKKYGNDMVPLPVIVEAKRPEEAVIYGCLSLMQ